MHCDQAIDAMSARLDNELSNDEMTRLGHHFETCAACAARFQELRVLNSRLKNELTDSDSIDIDRLWLQVSSAMDDADDARRLVQPRDIEFSNATETAGPTSDRPPSRRRFMSAGVALAGVAAGITAFSGYRYLVIPTPNVAGEAVSDFLTFRAGGMKLNIASADASHVKRWLTERVDFDIAINPAPPPGFTLRGGRLCSFLNRRLVFLYYENSNAAVSVYLMNQTGLDIPGSDLVRANDKNLSISRANGVSSALWKSDGLIFAAVSDLAVEQLVDFVSTI